MVSAFPASHTRMSQRGPGKRVFLTGASSGIGLATARILLAAGCQVWGTARALERLPVGLENFHPVQLDLNDERSIYEGFTAAQTAAGGRFEVLINNAGGGWFGPAAGLPAEELRKQFQTLVFGPMALIQLALPAMRTARSPEGLIVNVTSLAARLPLPYAAAYSAAKAALSSFSVTLRMEEMDASRGAIRFVDLQPGDIATNFNQAMSGPRELHGRQDRSSDGSDDDPAMAAARRVLEVSDRDMQNAPPPELIAQEICKLVFAKNVPAVRACGTFYQAVLGPLATRFLPAKFLERSIRAHFASR